ncbi:NfeD family protein [Nocardioides ferulae]|uniref:NfeD family protein n=1 Tax=Nocardioides ferulae TaxID=2340821 RepID=UPI0013DD8EE7|nr:NfeD family protein [Nocardioides ferulae]
MTVFLVIGLVGLVLLGVSLVLGDVFDGALDALAGDAFSSAVIGAFVAATGFGGAAAQALEAPMVVALPAGLAAGVVFGWFAWWLTRLIRDGGSDATVSIDDTVGRDGKVLTSIPTDGFGVVNILVGGHTLRLNARADQPLEPGTEVHVTSVLSPTAVTVAPIWNQLP